VGASVGVAPLSPAGGQVAFREADAALRLAKQSGKGCVRVADDAQAVTTDEDLATAIAEGTMSLRLDAACAPDGRIALVHAVPVWQHPVHGIVRGPDLWSGAERHGLSAAVQSWLVEHACAAVAALPDDDLVLAISLPAGHVTADGLAAQVADALDASGLPASRLTLSITEETLMTSSVALVPELEECRRTGVRLCLDNYGMGHSLFALLARIPLDLVRVDVTTLAGREEIDQALRVLGAIVTTTSTLGLSTIAGGISTADLRAAAVSAGVELLHGRHLPHDLTVDEARDLLAVATPA
jgi:EAL domain-containing protein (putative c-di-GMP-specific phosphodiesterase class I)